MEGSTVINFTTGSTANVLIVQSTWSTHTIKFDGQELPIASATTPANSKDVRLYTMTDVTAGSHQITRGSGESGILYIEVETEGSTGITTPQNTSVNNGSAYNLSGQRVSPSYRGIIIKNGKKFVHK